jgi:CheY-like chemotaxis protein
VLEQGDTLRRHLTRYADGVEIVAVRSVEEAVAELSRSPARALVVNAPPFGEQPVSRQQLADLPYGTPAVTCWVPGEDEAARRLGVVRYLTKPIGRETLLGALQDLGDDVETVLLVDDRPDAVQLFARMLSTAERRYRVLRARNGDRALSLLRQRHPDVMLLDLIMPGMDGFGVLQEKSEDPAIRGIPTVIISARDPAGEPIVGDTLTVARGGGFSVPDLLACIRAVSGILSPTMRSDGQGQTERPAG